MSMNVLAVVKQPYTKSVDLTMSDCTRIIGFCEDFIERYNDTIKSFDRQGYPDLANSLHRAKIDTINLILKLERTF